MKLNKPTFKEKNARTPHLKQKELEIHNDEILELAK